MKAKKRGTTPRKKTMTVKGRLSWVTALLLLLLAVTIAAWWLVRQPLSLTGSLTRTPPVSDIRRPTATETAIPAPVDTNIFLRLTALEDVVRTNTRSVTLVTNTFVAHVPPTTVLTNPPVDLTNIFRRITALETRVNNPPPPAVPAEVTQKLKALENSNAALKAEVVRLETRVNNPPPPPKPTDPSATERMRSAQEIHLKLLDN